MLYSKKQYPTYEEQFNNWPDFDFFGMIQQSILICRLCLLINNLLCFPADQDWVSCMLRPSLFARVPPYLRFRAHDAPPARPPPAVARHLRWRLTTITPVVVRRTLIASGFKLVRSECDAQGGKARTHSFPFHPLNCCIVFCVKSTHNKLNTVKR